MQKKLYYDGQVKRNWLKNFEYTKQQQKRS